MINSIQNERKKRMRKPIKLLHLFQILSMALVIIYNVEYFNKPSIIVAVLLILMTLISNLLISKITSGDNYILYIANMMFSIGIVMITRLEFSLGISQLKLYGIGIVAFFLVYLFLKKTIVFWKDKTLFYFIVCVLMFLATLLLGTDLYGARNWISILGHSIQLSEFTKIPLVMLVASFYYRYDEFSKKKFGKLYLNIAIYIFIGFFFLQRELGTALVFFVILVCSQIAYEKNKKIVIANILLASIGAVLAYFLFAHIRVRFEIWIDPWSSINDKGYQITQSLFAIASGGFFGTGVGLGNPNYIPLGYSDFIFAAICEEMGIFMGICLVLLFLILFYRGMKISIGKNDIFYSSLALAISVLFAAQSLIMFLGVLKLIPLTGITIPFVSHGGSSLISSFILLAILQICSEDTDKLEGKYEG